MVDHHPGRPTAVGRRGVELGLVRTRERGVDLLNAHPVPLDELRSALDVHEGSVSART